jgi:hypothetical protein
MRTKRFQSILCKGGLLACTWVALLGIAACGKDKTQTIREKVTERVQDFRLKKTAECRQALLVEAEKTVDSLLLLEATQALEDSLRRLRPLPPPKPSPIPPIDSASVRPLFN